MAFLVIVNPASRRGRAQRLVRELEQALRERGLDYRLAVTERPGHAEELARQAVAQHAHAVVVAGGDGTVGEVLNGIDLDTPLGILPIGTCNDIAYSLGLPDRDWRAALDRIAGGRTARADVGRCNDVRFLSVAGAGLDGRVARDFHRLPLALRRRPAYVALVLKHLLTARPFDFRLVIDGEATERRAWMVAVASTERYGGGMRIAPMARANDGRLHVCIVGDASRVELVRVFPRVFRGEHVNHPCFSVIDAERVEISANESLPLVIDGECREDLPATFSIEPAVLKVLGAGD